MLCNGTAGNVLVIGSKHAKHRARTSALKVSNCVVIAVHDVTNDVMTIIRRAMFLYKNVMKNSFRVNAVCLVMVIIRHSVYHEQYAFANSFKE